MTVMHDGGGVATNRLSREAAMRTAQSLHDSLGNADRARLDAILPLLAQDGRIRLSDAVTRLFPDTPRKDALTAFRQFRERLRSAVGSTLILEVDTATRTDPSNRWCWFAGDDAAANVTAKVESEKARAWEAAEVARIPDAAAKFVDAETRSVVRKPQDAIAVTVESVSKRPIRVFVSYAHDDARLKDDLLKRLRQQLSYDKHERFEFWDDGGITAGSKWSAAIQSNIESCDLGLLLVSPAFLGSAFITQHELPYFVAQDVAALKPCVPVALKPFRMDERADLHGIEHRQIVYHPRNRAFQDCERDRARDEFAGALRDSIVTALHDAAAAPASTQSVQEHVLEEWARDGLRDDPAAKLRVRQYGRIGSVRNLPDAVALADADGERRDALEFLLDWARDPEGQPCCALLGQLGMGKTTTCMALSRELLAARQNDRTAPLPIYFDLRHLGEDAKRELDLAAIIDIVLRRSWRGGQMQAPVAAAEVVRLVQQEGAIAIFDGLDEVLVHLSVRAGQLFTRELFRILPPNLWARRRKPGEPGRPGRVLVSCRTHYFRSVRDQNTHLTGEDRDDIRDGDYRVLLLLPFTDEQIRDYLTQTLPGEDIDRVMQTIGAVHNLPELAERPYTLSLIARALPELETWQLEGRRVTGVLLYQHMVSSWLERDAGKHEFDPEHKQQLMEHIAARLWRAGRRTWAARQMEDWLAGFLKQHPAVAMHYEKKDLEVLKKDLRTATFLVGGRRTEFRFAHTSLQEFFLAGFLLRALREGRAEDWDMPRPSDETLDFLGQLLLHEGDEAAIGTLRAMRGAYQPRISELAFRYVLLALEKGYPAPSAAGFRLDGADLRGWEIGAGGQMPLLNLRGASFRGARMRGAKLRQVDLEAADFFFADLALAEIIGSRARNANFARAWLTGTVLRGLDLAGATFEAANSYRTQLLLCRTGGAGALPDGVLTAPTFRAVSVTKSALRLAVLDGHSSWVRSAAFSPDGARIVSAASDRTLRLWDAASGECLSVLRGHDNSVNSAAFSPDGARIVSAASDRTLRLWDAASGECLSVLRGHDNSVNSAAFSPDGARIVSAAYDGTLRLWDAASGECLSVLRGHDNWVNSAAFSPDGARIVSAASDGTLRLWDAASGECLSVLRGHDNSVTSAAFSPDGARIVSAAYDGTLRLWDAASGECLSVLRGHDNSVNSAAFSPDGARIVSAADDSTLRLWDAASGECLSVLRGHDNWVNSAAFSPDGARIVSAADDRALRLWDAASGECLSVLRGHDNSVNSAAFSPDGARIVSAADDRALRLWDAASGECLSVLRGHDNSVNSAAFSPDGARIVSAADDRTLRLWDAASGECLSVLRGHDNSVNSAAFSPDGARIVSAASDRTLRLWDAASGECLSVLRGHDNSVNSAAFSPDGARIVSAASDRTLRLWDAASGECLSVLRGHDNSVNSAAFSPDGARIVSAASDGTLRLWDAASGECLSVLRGHDNSVTSAAFSPDGARIVSAAYDGTLRLWDAASGECLSVLRGHDDWVNSAAFSPDGARIVSAADDSTLRLWDAASGEECGCRVHQFADDAFAVIDPQGNRIIQAGGEAWRYLAWIGPDGVRYPAETFGPLPEFVEPQPSPASRAREAITNPPVE